MVIVPGLDQFSLGLIFVFTIMSVSVDFNNLVASIYSPGIDVVGSKGAHPASLPSGRGGRFFINHKHM